MTDGDAVQKKLRAVAQELRDIETQIVEGFRNLDKAEQGRRTMDGVITVTVLTVDGLDVEMKFPKKWTTVTGKRRAMESAVQAAMATFPNYSTIRGTWAPDMTYTEKDGLVTFRPVDLSAHAVLRFTTSEHEVPGEWLHGGWEYRAKEYEAGILLTHLRKAGLEVTNG